MYYNQNIIHSIFVDKYNLNQHNRSHNGLFITLSLFTAFPNVGFIRISIYFLFCWNSGKYKICKTKNTAAVSLCKELRGALWARLSPLHNDIWVLTRVCNGQTIFFEKVVIKSSAECYTARRLAF